MKIAVAGGTGTVGRHVVEALRAAGHAPLVLSRSTGTDLLTGEGLAASLHGVAAVVDVSATTTTSSTESVRFFGTVTRNLREAERLAGVRHHVALSIIGARKVNAGYHAGKAVQEEILNAEPSGWSLLRATQFHEFATQLLDHGKLGPCRSCQPCDRSLSRPPRWPQNSSRSRSTTRGDRSRTSLARKRRTWPTS